jgi:hypothetical protein
MSMVSIGSILLWHEHVHVHEVEKLTRPCQWGRNIYLDTYKEACVCVYLGSILLVGYRYKVALVHPRSTLFLQSFCQRQSRRNTVARHEHAFRSAHGLGQRLTKGLLNVRVQVVPRLFLPSIQDPVRHWIGPVTDRVGQHIVQDLFPIHVWMTGGLAEGGAGQCHEGHLDRFEQDGLLIPFGSNGEREFATRNRQHLTRRCANRAAIECDTPPCCGGIVVAITVAVAVRGFFRSRSGSSGRQLLLQVFTVLGEFARDTRGTIGAVHTPEIGDVTVLSLLLLLLLSSSTDTHGAAVSATRTCW